MTISLASLYYELLILVKKVSFVLLIFPFVSTSAIHYHIIHIILFLENFFQHEWGKHFAISKTQKGIGWILTDVLTILHHQQDHIYFLMIQFVFFLKRKQEIWIFLMFFSINLDESFVVLGNINNTDS